MASTITKALKRINPFAKPKRRRERQSTEMTRVYNPNDPADFPVFGVATTEVCNLSCVMCHFNGPGVKKRKRTLSVEQVEKFMKQIPKGRQLWFSGTGDFFMDPHALEHVRLAHAHGHKPCILTHGQLFSPEVLDSLLENGVRFIRMSVDAIDAETYKNIRLGGKFERILEACAYLRKKKEKYPDLRVEINNTILKPNDDLIQQYCDFWRGKVDGINFNAEYYDTFHFRNTFRPIPEKRNDCELSVYVLPSGRMAPCCATMVVQHEKDQEWMPHIDETSPKEAFQKFQQMYKDPESPLRKICAQCGWWILWAYDEKGETPYWKHVEL